MKTTIAIIIALVIALGAGYFGVPMLMETHTSALRSEVQDLKLKVQKMEDEAKGAPLPHDAGAGQIIKTVNAVSAKLNSMEESFRKDMSSADGLIKKQKTETEEALRKQTEAIEKNLREAQAKAQSVKFKSAIADIREHILKARLETVAKNIGNARAEVDVIDDLLSEVIAFATEENKKTLSDLQTSVKKIKSDIDTDLPSAVNRLNSLWHEMSRLLRKA